MDGWSVARLTLTSPLAVMTTFMNSFRRVRSGLTMPLKRKKGDLSCCTNCMKGIACLPGCHTVKHTTNQASWNSTAATILMNYTTPWRLRGGLDFSWTEYFFIFSVINWDKKLPRANLGSFRF